MTATSLPRIVILADRGGEELLPLSRANPVALLSIAARTLLDISIEPLLPLAATELDMVLCAHSDRIREHVAGKRSWGIKISPVLSQGDEAPKAVLQRAGRLVAGEYLVLRADMLRVGDIAQFLSAARSQPAACVSAVVAGKPAGLWYCASEHDLDSVPGWPLTEQSSATHELVDGYSDALEDLSAFHRSNMDAIAGRINALQLPARSAGENLFLGRGARCAVRPQEHAKVLIGQNSQVLSGVTLSGSVVIGDNVIVDRDSLIEDSVILPHSYIGSGVELRQAIVSGNSLIRADSGAELTVVDAFLLADLQHAELPARIAAPLHRLAGFILLLLSAPLWPFAAIVAWLQHPDQPILKYTFLGTPPLAMAGAIPRHAYNGWHWNTQIPILRALPRLIALMRGQLRLLGTAPLSESEASSRTVEWQYLADEAPAGLIGPTQLLLRAHDPLEERLLSDAFYVRQRSLKGDLLLLLRACLSLFSSRAWTHGAHS